jgi:hypothetical protein
VFLKILIGLLWVNFWVDFIEQFMDYRGSLSEGEKTRLRVRQRGRVALRERISGEKKRGFVRTEDETESGRERDSVTGEEKERAETMTGVAVREEAAPWRRCWATVYKVLFLTD